MFELLALASALFSLVLFVLLYDPHDKNPRIQCPCAWLFEILEHLDEQMAFRCLNAPVNDGHFFAWFFVHDFIKFVKFPVFFFKGNIQKTDRQIFPFLFVLKVLTKNLSMMWIL